MHGKSDSLHKMSIIDLRSTVELQILTTANFDNGKF